MEFRKLRADEIDCRIARITNYSVKLLLYKDARCDMNILDETVGSTNWMRSHTRDNANCIVSIWDEIKNQWIAKEDTGTESNTEKEKGLASDSFKRACFNWGIGRELYTAPDISFGLADCRVVDGKCYDRFSVEDIGYEGNVIARLVVKNETTGRKYCYPSTNTYIQEGEVKETSIEELLKATGVPLEKILKMYNVENIEQMTKAKKEACVKWLKSQVK